MRQWLYALLLAAFALPSSAGQSINIKDIEVHYSAFNSTFLTPQVARSYQLTRNGYSAILNISVLDTASLGKPALEAHISGQVRNLIGQTRSLQFREIKEDKAIYYLAEFRISNEESLTFDIAIDAGNKGTGKLRFTQKFYVQP
ncbi:DUF4426 domain-containing protein [Vibrio cincinnatiensis]|jgi:hypothetical protein|uniref:DUF4426 domain-containing protein n=1 Tax=Vibrio cincinnatiensis TaxID=675 RepID=UPI001302502B|nr:DUF4426 domain-containing protein [Vibrio cincinnatiensis]MCG3721842.1 DUF4426 domain-containing protein [Vibrio cincinnatiensis]MCG3733557.1 DUF4426 domain-containing protein [Vibrio cincinnatiensis]MCG3737264.1 DUF4426 domain-containing protein [Vibrio cincinnatiensis]MCG3740217.1 DUF4426 domain-containing protein [Vibrio cincinnatiensis]MCG3744543.1 DUF4426 domain-containing protein [Vibrio cincinnatiensis]